MFCHCRVGLFAHPRRPRGYPGVTQGSGEKARRKYSSAGGRAPGYQGRPAGYRLLPDHSQTVEWMLAPDWAQKMLCIIVPNRWTSSPKSFLCVRTRLLLSRRTILYLSGSLFTKVVPNQKSAFAWLLDSTDFPLGLRGLFLCCTFGKHQVPLSAVISIPFIFFRYKTRNAFRRNVQLVSIFLSYQGTCSLDKLKDTWLT